MLQHLFQTDNNYTWTFIRLVAGIIIFPYGMQKLAGWFKDFGGGVGIRASLAQFKKKNIPLLFAWMVIIGQSLGSIALIIGFAGRIAAAGNFIIFTGAMINHIKDGWVMNWMGKKKGEGVEYFVMLLALLSVIVIKGSGALSFDRWF